MQRFTTEEYDIEAKARDNWDDYSNDTKAKPGRRSVLLWLRGNWKRWAWVAALLIIALIIYRSVSAPANVHVAVVRSVQAVETLGATGKVVGEKQADLGLSITGTVRRIYVKEGDFVHKGALVLSVDGLDLQAGVDAARAAVESANAELARAGRPPLQSDIAQARAEIAQAESVGRAKIEQAQARLKDLKSGSRPQEIAQAQAQLKREQAILAKAQSDLKRAQQLVKAGAMAKSGLDAAQTDVETAQANVQAQQDLVNLLKSGARPDQIAEANASLAEARAYYATSVRAARERLKSLLAHPRREDVNVARANVMEAQANLQRAQGDRRKTDLVAPFDGLVASVPVEEGNSITPGQTLVIFQEMNKPVIEVETDEENLSSLSIGQKAIVTANAFPGRRFTATVYDLGSMVNPERGTVKIKLRPDKNVDWLRPDLTMDVNIVTHGKAQRVILPADTLTKAGGTSVVLVVKDGETIAVPVKVGAMGADGLTVSGNLKTGDMVIRNASLVKPGETVRVLED